MRKISKLFFIVVFFVFIFSVFQRTTFTRVYASESISSFYSIVEINQDTSVKITEQISYTTTEEKHGIYRYIPIKYHKNGTVEVLPVSKISVTDENGSSIPFTRSSDGKNITLKIGDPNSTFTGEKNYVLSYSVSRAITLLDDHAELYWDITGEGWQIPVQQSAASVISKYAPIENLDCFTGPFDSDNGLCNFESGQNQATFSYAEPIYYGDNMTILVTFPKESMLQFPSKIDLLFIWIRSNFALLLLPIPTIVMFVWWYKKGRDFEFTSQNVFLLDTKNSVRHKSVFSKRPDPMVYEPLKHLSPGESGALLDEKVDIQDIVAEILELARKKYLKITAIETKVLFITNKDYKFKKLREVEVNSVPSKSSLTTVQEFLFTEIFKSGNTVSLSELKGTFYTAVDRAKALMESSLIAKKVYTVEPTKVRGIGVLSVIVMEGFLFLLLSDTIFPLGIYWPIPVIVLQTITSLVFAWNLVQKTAVGNNLYLQARGLRTSIKRGTWREKIKEKHLFIEEVLPFAVSLGVVRQLAKDMAELQLQPPVYLSASGLHLLNTAGFVSDFSQELGNSLSYNPSSSSMGSSGSSGGGGGGGGGGSW